MDEVKYRHIIRLGKSFTLRYRTYDLAKEDLPRWRRWWGIDVGIEYDAEGDEEYTCD